MRIFEGPEFKKGEDVTEPRELHEWSFLSIRINYDLFYVIQVTEYVCLLKCSSCVSVLSMLMFQPRHQAVLSPLQSVSPRNAIAPWLM